jgi:nicotinamide mononucleotide (NMN) deamidase PncC
MNTDVERLIQKLHASPRMAVLAVTGGGAEALSWLLTVPGASNTVLEAVSPYSEAALRDFLDCETDQAASGDTAREMARIAYRRATRLRPDDRAATGVACTASIASNRPKRGDHRCHVAAWTDTGVTTYSLVLSKGLRDRSGEDTIASLLVLKAMAASYGIDFGLSPDLVESEEIGVEVVSYSDPLEAMLAGHVASVVVSPDGAMSADAAVGGAILSGSFDPLHAGHLELAKTAEDMLHSDIIYELSVTNVDKLPLSEQETRNRTGQFKGRATVVVTNAEVFHKKAGLFPGRTFVIGVDTADRLVNPRYYGGSPSEMLMALYETRRSGCAFLVAGRERDGTFRTLNDVPVPREFAEMFSSIPESKFRSEVSSTELRLTDPKG